MNRGLIITHTSTLKGGVLKFYSAEIWQEGKTTFLKSILGKDANDLISKIGLVQNGITWLSGPAATKSLAKRYGLAYRKRVPGGGRKRVAIEAKKKRITIWMTPSGITELHDLAKFHGLSAGDQVESMTKLGTKN